MTKNPFKSGQIIEGLVKHHSFMNGHTETWLRMQVVSVVRKTGNMQVTIFKVEPYFDNDFSTWLAYKPDWFRLPGRGSQE